MNLGLRARPPGRTPWGFLGMIALIVLAERFVSQNAIDFTRPEYWDWKWTGQMARSKARDCRVLCFGTSRLQQSILPKVIEAKTGWRTWNLSACWGQAPAYYFLLKRALDAGARPAAVIVEYHPGALSGTYWGAIRYWPDLLSPRETLDLAATARDAEFFASTTLAHWFPSIKDRFQIRANLIAALGGGKSDLTLSTLTTIRNRNVNRGAYVLMKNIQYRGEVSAAYEAALLPASWECDPTNRRYIKRLLDLAASHKVPVYWTLPPFCPALQVRREANGLDARFSAFVRSWQERYPGLVVLDAQRSGFVADVFIDACHLDRRGACALSAAVGDVLRDRARTVRGERWVALPDYREWAPTVPVEDIVMSQEFLKNRRAARR